MPERIIRWVTRDKIRVSAKQFFLLFAGMFGIIRGVSYINPPTVPAGLRTIAQIPSLDAWGWMWVAVGFIAVVGAFTKHYRLTFIPLMVMSTIWGGSYLAEWSMDFFVRGVDSRDYITAVSYAVQALAILTIIRLIDPAEVRAKGGLDD